jgi:hypothetical protein
MRLTELDHAAAACGYWQRWARVARVNSARSRVTRVRGRCSGGSSTCSPTPARPRASAAHDLMQI